MGYVINQMTKFDRFYNDIGCDFLSELSRNPRDINDIIDKLHHLYGDTVSKLELAQDFNAFINDLEKNKFVVTGESVDELDNADVSFSYSLDNPKTSTNLFLQDSTVSVQADSQNIMLETTRLKPSLNGLQFELTSRCNERCIHCYIPNSKKNAGADMPLEKVYSIIDEYYEMGGLAVTLSGGEVFLHKNIMEIIDYCRQKDMMITILSNLLNLKDWQIPLLKDSNISLLQTSLYSMDADIHDTITTVKGSHAKTKMAIEKLVAADIPIQISCPVMKANRKGYGEVLVYAQKLKCRAMSDFIMIAQADLNTNNLSNRISLEETEELIRDIIKYDVDYRQSILSKPSYTSTDKNRYDESSRYAMCGVGLNTCCITENGDVYPCAGWQDMVVGNVYRQSLKEIWEHSNELNRLRSITKGDFPKCLHCEARDYCSPCLVRNYNENKGDMFAITEHFCNVAFLTKKLVEEFRNGEAENQ